MQLNLSGRKAKAPCVIIDNIKYFPSRINGEKVLVNRRGWIYGGQYPYGWKQHKNGITLRVPRALMEEECEWCGKELINCSCAEMPTYKYEKEVPNSSHN